MSLSRIEKHGHARSNEIVRLDFAYRKREREKKEWMSKKKIDVGMLNKDLCVFFEKMPGESKI
jgi:hypothetical protein